MTKTNIPTPNRLRHQLAATLNRLATVPAMLATLALPLVLATSCASDELVTPANPIPGQQITITASLGDASSNSKPGTRMDYQPNTDTTIGGLQAIWMYGDAFNIEPINNSNDPTGIAQLFTLDDASAGKVEGTFTGTAPAKGDTYYIYHPTSIKTRKDLIAFLTPDRCKQETDIEMASLPFTP